MREYPTLKLEYIGDGWDIRVIGSGWYKLAGRGWIYVEECDVMWFIC